MSTLRGVPVGVLIACASACSGGGGSDAVDAATTIVDAAADASGCGDCDAPPACSAWLLVPRTARTVALFDERLAINAARTFRVVIEYETTEDEEPAMPTIGRGMGGMVIQPMVFAPIVVGSSRVDLQACKLEYSIVSPK